VRIVYDHQIFGAQKFGGISRYFCAVAREINELPGQSAQIVAPIYRNVHLRSVAGPFVTGWHVPALRRTERITRLISTVLFPALARRFRPSVVHETYYSPRATYPDGVARVLTVFDMAHERFPDDFPRGDTTAAAKASAIARADQIICISRHTRDELTRFHRVPPERVRVIHLGFDRLEAGGLPASDLVGARPYLLYVGARNGYKNFGRLVEAYADSPLLRRSVRIVCVGGAPLSDDERRGFAERGLSDGDVVRVVGRDRELASLYSAAALFVYPSLYEGFGIPPLEAMALGCPVACSRTSSIPEVVGDAAELFDPTNAESIKHSIERVVFAPSLREELVRRGGARVTEFSWARCAGETMEAYRDLTAFRD
jgi:glycosyltransferase involved in cell wall biosynthesis